MSVSQLLDESTVGQQVLLSGGLTAYSLDCAELTVSSSRFGPGGLPGSGFSIQNPGDFSKLSIGSSVAAGAERSSILTEAQLWSASKTYSAGAIVRYDDGGGVATWVALTPGSSGVAPIAPNWSKQTVGPFTTGTYRALNQTCDANGGQDITIGDKDGNGTKPVLDVRAYPDGADAYAAVDGALRWRGFTVYNGLGQGWAAGGQALFDTISGDNEVEFVCHKDALKTGGYAFYNGDNGAPVAGLNLCATIGDTTWNGAQKVGQVNSSVVRSGALRFDLGLKDLTWGEGTLTAGQVVVNTPYADADSYVIVSYKTPIGNAGCWLGPIVPTIVPGVSITFNSWAGGAGVPALDGTNNSKFYWQIVNPRA